MLDKFVQLTVTVTVMRIEARVKLKTILILLLFQQANLTKRILPACLPTDPSENLEGQELTVAGWGWTSFGKLSQQFGKVGGTRT